MNTMDDLKREAQDLIRQLVAGDFAGSRRLFDRDLLQVFPETRLRDTWLQLTGLFGPFQGIATCTATDGPEDRVVLVSCQFLKAPVEFRVSVVTG
jgi:hypothetical protein